MSLKVSVTGLQRYSLDYALYPFLHLPQCVRFSIYGASGSGKSYLSDQILTKWPGLKVLMDPDPTEPRGREITSLESFKRIADFSSETLVITSIPLFLRVCRQIFWHWKDECMLLIDEADLVLSTSKPQPEFMSLLKRGRRRGISVGISTQYPTEIHKIARNLVNVQICGNFTGRAGRKWSMDTLGVDALEIPPHTFVIKSPMYSPEPGIVAP